MSSRWTQLGLFSLLLVGCTDGRPMRTQVELFSVTPPPSTSLISAAEVQFGGRNTDALQMAVKGTSLYMTGRPFGFTRWEIGADPENPSITFAASDQIQTFTPMGSWVVDWYSGGALAIWGAYAFMSGTVGTSVVSMAETNAPKEILRYPALDPNSSQVPADAAFSYTALVKHPTLNILYGFRKQDYVYTVGMNSQGLRLISRDAYGAPGESVCCVSGATAFANRVWVAFRDRLVFFDLGANGALENTQESLELNAVNVVSTQRYLYVQHEPTASVSTGSSRPSGIYVFDTSGRSVAFFKASSPRRFAVSSDDRHFYSNIDGTRVEIYRIQWPN